jgi:hypothetical protein
MEKNDSKNNSRFVWLSNFLSKFKDTIINVFTAHKDGLIWFLLTCLWALLIPMFARMAIPSFDYNFWNFLSEGDIVLFSMVITSSLVIDDFLFGRGFSEVLDERQSKQGLDKKKDLEFQKRLFIHISPMLIIVFCLIIYLRCQAVKECIDISTIIAEIFLFMLVAAYAAFVKQTSWAEKDKNEKDKEEKTSSSQLNNQMRTAKS